MPVTRLASLLAGIQGRGDDRCLFAEGRWHSYRDLVQRLQSWQQQIDAARIPRGSVVGLQSDYSLDSIAFLLAAWSGGLVLALLPRGDIDAAMLADARVTLSVTLVDHSAPVWKQAGPFESHALLDQLRLQGSPGVVLFTSGSTGIAKAALHAAERFLGKFDRPGRALRTLALLQFDHVAGLDTLLYTLSAGGALVPPVARDAQSICRLIEAARVQVLSASPSFLRLLWASGAASAHDLSSLQVITYGSEPMDPATLVRLNDLFPGVRISQKYGTTETGAPRTVSRGSDSLWIQLAGEGLTTQVRDGILWIRGEGTFLGYLNARNGTDPDGWYCTGDVVEQDGPWLRVLGREGQLINVGGEKVSPVEVEQVILELEQIASVAVSGVAHPLLGQIVTAEVTLRGSQDAENIEAVVRRHCATRLARHKVPVTVDISATPLTSERQKTLRRRF